MCSYNCEGLKSSLGALTMLCSNHDIIILQETWLQGRVVKGVGHLGHDEVMEAGGREFDPRPGHYSRMSF